LPRLVTRAFYEHNFPAPHIDAVEYFIDYRVPVEKFGALAEFDGSVIVERVLSDEDLEQAVREGDGR